jgi:hypothetical protein
MEVEEMIAKAFLWIAIVSSGIVIFSYEIWNLIVVLRDFARISQEAKEQELKGKA